MTFRTVYPRRKSQSAPIMSKTIHDLMNLSLKDAIDGKIEHNRPTANIIEAKESFSIQLAVPGLTKSDIQLKLEKNKLTVSANKEEEKNEKLKMRRAEFNYSKFNRSFILPSTIDVSKIEAAAENGILTITLAKKEEAVDKGPIDIKIN